MRPSKLLTFICCGSLSLGAAAETVVFQNGLNGYSGNRTLAISSGSPASNFTDTALWVDKSNSSYGPTGETQVLISFDDIFGVGAIPLGATITSASLRFFTTDPTPNTISLHRMLENWGSGTTWGSLGNDGLTPGDEAALLAVSSHSVPTDEASTTFNVTGSVTRWAAGAGNFGWAIFDSGTNGWQFNTELFNSSDSALVALRRPELTINYTINSTPVPLPPSLGLLAGAAMVLVRRRTQA